MSAIETIGRKWAPIKAAERARAERRAHAVHFYTGRNGSAKSMCAVFDTLPDLDAGTPVLSTIRLVDWRNPRPCDDDGCMSARHGKPGHLAAHPAWVPWAQSHGGGGWPQFLDFRDGIILADEVTGIADAHEWASIPVQVTNQWAQLRRRNVVMRMTGLDFINLHKRLRQATNAVTRCRSFLPLVIQGDDGEDLMWRQRRLSAWTTYDAQTLPRDEPSESAWESAQVLSRSRFWIPGSDAAMAYDTFDEVGVIETVTEKGDCAHCGGRRTQPQCTCPDYTDGRTGRRAPDRKRSEDRRTATGTDAAQPVHDHECGAVLDLVR